MSLKDPTRLRTWKYSAANLGGRSIYVMNENLTGAVLGVQKPARINFRTALLIVEGWNRLNSGIGTKYWLVIPNEP